MSDASLTEERRRGPDRRRRPTPMLSRYILTGRRQAFRRQEEGANSYVDRYGPWMIAALVAILGLCLLDALFTLLYIQRGGGELNPVMGAALGAGVGVFLAVKIGLTAAGILFLCLHKNFRLVRPLIGLVFVCYVLLTVYHLYLAALG